MGTASVTASRAEAEVPGCAMSGLVRIACSACLVLAEGVPGTVTKHEAPPDWGI